MKSNAITRSVGTMRKEAMDWEWQYSTLESVLSIKMVHFYINPSNLFFKAYFLIWKSTFSVITNTLIY